MTNHRAGPRGTASTRTDRGRFVRIAAAVVAASFVLVGILGFVPGVTTGLGSLTMASHDSGAALLGLFDVTVLHNALHLAAGLAGLLLALAPRTAAAFLFVGGIAYLALWVFGLVGDRRGAANVLALNGADNWLHLGLGAGMVVLAAVGYRLWRGTVTPDTA